MDKISWVDGTEAHCVSIGTLVTLIDNIVLAAQETLTQYNIQGRTPVSYDMYDLCVSDLFHCFNSITESNIFSL